jgi:hypothetical protein
MRHPFGAVVQLSGAFTPPTSSALTPLFEMNSTDNGRLNPAGREAVSC